MIGYQKQKVTEKENLNVRIQSKFSIITIPL